MVQSVNGWPLWLWHSDNDGKCSFPIPCCINTDRRTFRTVEQIWKEPLFSQKNTACARRPRKFLMPLRVCPGGVVQQAYVILTSWSDLQWVRPHSENGNETPKKLFTWTVQVVEYEKDSQQENSYRHHRSSVPKCTAASYVHAFIKLDMSIINTKCFLIHTPSWDIGLKLGFKTSS